jgi:Ethanolamine ammonia-lyase, large subunit
MGCDVCYTNHAEADQDDMDALLTLLTTAGVNFVMGVPGADDIMLGIRAPRSTTRSPCAICSAAARRRNSRPGSRARD